MFQCSKMHWMGVILTYLICKRWLSESKIKSSGQDWDSSVAKTTKHPTGKEHNKNSSIVFRNLA